MKRTIPPPPPSKRDPKGAAQVAKRIQRTRATEDHATAIRRIVRQIPKGRVATYSQVAAAAGYPLYHRQVVQVLRTAGGAVPWQRVVGAGGYIKLRGEAGYDQRVRLEMEGVAFRGKRIDMEAHQHKFRQWDFDD